MVVVYLCTSCKRAPEHNRWKWHCCCQTFSASSAVDSVDPLPFKSLSVVQSTRDILYHHCQFLKRSLPAEFFLFPTSAKAKKIMLFGHTVFNRACGELNPSNILSKSIAISSSVRAVVAFGLFPCPCRLSCFVSLSTLLLFFFLKSLSFKLLLP